jgi:DNA-binding MarR family transcriptional regulator
METGPHEPEPVGLLIAAARRRIKQAVGARVRPHRVSPQQFWFLIAVLENEGLSMRERGARARVDAPTTSRVVTALVARGLLRAGTDPRDRRRARLCLTPRGRTLADRLQPVASEIRRTVREGISAQEAETLKDLLRRVIANMDRCVRRGESS